LRQRLVILRQRLVILRQRLVILRLRRWILMQTWLGSFYRISVGVLVGLGLLIAVVTQDVFGAALLVAAGFCMLWGGRP
jgi:hypothetical protein